MKIFIDNENKTITIHEDVNIKELMDFIRTAIPDDYESYKIVKTVDYVYINTQPYNPCIPLDYPRQPNKPYPDYPHTHPFTPFTPFYY